MQVWQVNDYEWWAGEGLDAIKLAHHTQTGIDPEDEEEGGFDSPRLLDDAAMNKLRFCHDDGDPVEIAKYGHTECSFADRLKELEAEGASFPCFFAGTEY
jgi:hypothetical protein